MQSEFVKTLISAYKPLVIQRSKDPKSSSIGNGTKALSRVFERYMSLENHLNKLGIIIHFLKTREITKPLQDSGLRESEYYQYLFENYIVQLVSTQDVCAKIGNELLVKRIAEKYCNAFTFIDNHEIKDSESGQRLLELTEYLTNHRTNRHLIIHSGNFESHEAKDLDGLLYDHFMEGELEEEVKSFLTLERDSKFLEQIQNIQSTNEHIVEYCFAFLESLIPTLNERILIWTKIEQ
ncbi:MAG: Cthe_2314 family HEPN domain-containing protein [Flavobacteriales bacterium]